jgi:hypothetical protein
MKLYDIVRDPSGTVDIISEVCSSSVFEVRFGKRVKYYEKDQLVVVSDNDDILEGTDDHDHYCAIAHNIYTGDKIALMGFSPSEDESEVTCSFQHLATGSIIEYTISLAADKSRIYSIVQLSLDGTACLLKDLNENLRSWVLNDADMHADLVSGNMNVELL